MASLLLRYKSHPFNLKPNHTLLNFIHVYSFSSSSINNGNDENTENQQSSSSSSSSNYFGASNHTSLSSERRSSYDEIRQNLSEFHRRSSDASFPANLNRQMPLSSQNANPNPNPNPSLTKSWTLSINSIRENLQKMKDNRGNNNMNRRLSFDSIKQSVRMEPNISNAGDNNKNMMKVIGGSIDSLPSATFGREIKEKEGIYSEEDKEKRFELIKTYRHDELGEKLKQLRPDTSTLLKNKKRTKEGEGGWFSLSELQQRLAKLKEIEEKESSADKNRLIFRDLRKGLQTIEKPKAARNLNLLSLPSFMHSPPKEHLVEKYFHPDNMSAAEKLKLELKKVRDEFKMSESDCGSTRVQIAQLTTEIHHLSSVLHKKDKHSRRGLQAKVQQRKKLLKYLRRTDWDSYCFVLSKLGLRDNPDYKN